jgi:hypothetical protein
MNVKTITASLLFLLTLLGACVPYGPPPRAERALDVVVEAERWRPVDEAVPWTTGAPPRWRFTAELTRPVRVVEAYWLAAETDPDAGPAPYLIMGVGDETGRALELGGVGARSYPREGDPPSPAVSGTLRLLWTGEEPPARATVSLAYE